MKILMVCLGNICRSPLAEGIMKNLLTKEPKLRWKIDSAGTASYHVGSQPDKRSVAEAEKHGIDLTTIRSRQLSNMDFYTHDIILAMDAENYNNIIKIQPSDSHARVELIMNYAFPKENRQVPDPYYEGGFDEVYNMLEHACTAFIKMNS